jgi:PAS domain S-box-containing protein
MKPLVPKSNAAKVGQQFTELSELLLSALDFLGAAAGWIGLQDAGGGLTFPVRAGVVSDSWLAWQQGYGSIWGFTVGGEPALLNDLKSGAALDEPPLRNLLSCPLIHNHQILGHVALANKAQGFTAEDARVLQGLAHHMVRLLVRRPAPAAPLELSAAWRRILDCDAEGVLLLDKSGVLIYANRTWLDWTGFRAEELVGRTAPFPFWVSQQDLVQALSAAPAHALPFRRRDQSLFWCRLETAEEQWGGHLVTVAFLRQLQAHGGPAARDEPPHIRFPEPDWLALLLDLDNGIEGWEARWEERTGLSAHDVEGSRTVLVLDWLFPQQHDRDRVFDCFHHLGSPGCQLVLELAAPHGSRRVLCTLLPLPSRTVAGMPRRWLLLVGEAEQAAQPNHSEATTQREPGG